MLQKLSLKFRRLEFFITSSLLSLYTFFILYLYKSGSAKGYEVVMLIVILLLVSLIFGVSFLAKAKWKDLLPLGIYLILISLSVFLKNFSSALFQKNTLFSLLFGNDRQDGIFAFTVIPVSILIISFILTKFSLKLSKTLTFTTTNQDKLNKILKFLNSFWLNIILSFSLSLYYSVLTLLLHQSFGTHVYDFGIFDQAIFMLSRFEVPASTTRQFTNIFYDHQHFSLVVLAPLYWIFKGLNGQLLIFITPFLLITIPSFFLYKTFETLVQAKFGSNKKYYWLIGLGSFLLWQHPFTQSSVGFYFHEKYLFPVFFTALVYFLSQFWLKKNFLSLVLVFVFNLLWLGTKEDQWLFAVVFWIQMTVIFYILSQFSVIKTSFLRQRKVWMLLVSNILIGIIYGTVFLKWFVSQNKYVGNYSKLYDESTQYFQDFFGNGSIVGLSQNLKLFDAVNQFLYQNFLLFDLVGIFVLPLNILGNYLERVLALHFTFKSPSFHYGVDVPIYTLTSILIIYLLMLIFKKYDLAKGSIIFCILTYILGFVFVSGWNNIFYLSTNTGRVLESYSKTKAERKSFNKIVKSIPAEASIVSSPTYATHFTARKKVANFPVLHNFPEDYPGRNKLEEFEYWLLPKQSVGETQEIYQNQIKELKSKNYEVVEENEYQILLVKI